MITDRQLAIIKTKIIWMTGRPTPNRAYINWWEKHDPFIMEKQAESLPSNQAYKLIGAAIQGNWDKEGGVIQLWKYYIESMELKQIRA